MTQQHGDARGPDRPPQPQPAQAATPAAGSGAASAFWGAASTALDDWLSFASDGTLTVFSGKVELGTGVRTALAQIVAEELDLPLASIQLVMGDSARTPNEGYTAGSNTIQQSGTALRHAAAEARQALIELAAERLEAAPDDLETTAGAIAVRGTPSRRVTYAALIGGQRFERTVTRQAPLKSPAAYTIVGQPAPRLDLPRIFTGQPTFVHDLRLPGMLHARVARPPSPGATLLTLDASAVRDAQVVRLGSFVAVVAAREEVAMRAVERLKLTWRESARLPSQDELFTFLRGQPSTDQVVAERGDVAAALAGAVTQVRATYAQPYQAHASIGPSCAVASVAADGSITIWCASQGVFALRGALADLLELPVERVRVIFLEGAGCYGHNGADDVAADAAVLARAVGQPVRVQWSRADEFAWEPKAPAMLIEAHGGLDAHGQIAAWESTVRSPSHVSRARVGLDLLAGQLIHERPAPERTFFVGGERNAPTDYELPHHRVTLRWLARSPLRVSSMRSLGATANTFANESFMDELALAAHSDPVEFRLRHLTDPRARAVVEAAARQASWDTPLPPGTGRGIAFARYENREAYVATVAEARVDPDSGAVRVARIFVAHDCGQIINPDGVRNQIEGNVIQSASRALKEEVHFAATSVTSLDWATYPILTFSEMPAIEIILLDRSDQPSVGAGEPATITTAPAIANAIYAASGARVRQVPFTPARVRAALAAAHPPA
jgi:CO/xanthine dehydrogenase Mo-binding subunit